MLVGGCALCTQNENDARVFNLWARWSYSRKLQLFLHPRPLSSLGFGGLHFHDQS
jgi:hypothetical protein